MKKTIAFFLSMTMVLSLAACGTNEADRSEQTDSTADSAEQADSASVDSGETEDTEDVEEAQQKRTPMSWFRRGLTLPIMWS